jgi:hypothetical protein
MEQANIENIEKALNAWIKSSDDNYDEMLDFYKINRNNWSLFIGHWFGEVIKSILHQSQSSAFSKPAQFD